MNTTSVSDGRQQAVMLSDIRTLTAFEMGWYGTNFVITKRKMEGRSRWLSRSTVAMLLFLIACTLTAAKLLAQAEDVLALVLTIWVVGCIFVGLAVSLGVSRSRFRDWWLGFPYPRSALIFSKWLAAVLNALRWFGILFSWSAVTYLVGWALHPAHFAPNKSLLLYAVLTIVTVVIAAPVLNALTLALISIEGMWSKVLQLTVFGTLVSSFLLLQALWAIARSGDLTPWLYTLGALFIVGWPVSALLLWTAARYLSTASRPFADTASINSRRWRRDLKTEMDTDLAPSLAQGHPGVGAASNRSVPGAAWLYWYEQMAKRPAPRFFALFSLQASPLRWFGAGADVRLKMFALLLPILGFAAGLVVHRQSHVVDLPTAFLFFGAGMTMWMGVSGAFGRTLKTSAGWLLGYPLSRAAILVASSAAWWIRWGALVVFTESGIWLGILVRGLVDPLPLSDYHLAAEAFGRASLLSIALFPLLQLILQTSSYALRRLSAWLQVAVLVSIWVMSTRGVHSAHAFTDPHSWLLGSQYWIIIALTLVIGIPLAIWFVRTAARNLHVVFTNPLRQRM
ncbi:hypothetical protein [Alicyclobacillus sp. ALC3]|uniref:hypothetical protein n=1 Tax=Alicyclobacillus sp. ALC3 TaxID=2796143 RepID=UPI0023780706|nr:hypothetical protein [Alicyclobacillus sp. ALC3]WDL98451.1 hypothetical protein JC200_07145 [Alicyclobacillus sp. ALC3]